MPCRHAVEQARQISVRPATSCTSSTGGDGPTNLAGRLGRPISLERTTRFAPSVVGCAWRAVREVAAGGGACGTRCGSDAVTSDRAMAGPRIRVVTVRQAWIGSAASVVRPLGRVAMPIGAACAIVASGASTSWRRNAFRQRRFARSVDHQGSVTARIRRSRGDVRGGSDG